MNKLFIRFFDLFFSAAGLILLSPFFFIIALAVKVNSSGSVFYKQSRVGQNNKDFMLYKFRTMHSQADQKGLITVGEKDSRITSIGYFLRKFKIDELPQLINVLLGTMSLVGPRPEVRKYVNYYTEEQLKVLVVKPGITDFASIEYANESELLGLSANPDETYIREIMPMKILLNQKFIRNRTVRNYFHIIFKTLIKVIG